MKVPENVGSKYRFIILAGQRVSQLQRGAKPRLEGRESEKMTTIATAELEEELLTFKKIDQLDPDSMVAPDNVQAPELLSDTGKKAAEAS